MLMYWFWRQGALWNYYRSFLMKFAPEHLWQTSYFLASAHFTFLITGNVILFVFKHVFMTLVPWNTFTVSGINWKHWWMSMRSQSVCPWNVEILRMKEAHWTSVMLLVQGQFTAFLYQPSITLFQTFGPQKSSEMKGKTINCTKPGWAEAPKCKIESGRE